MQDLLAHLHLNLDSEPTGERFLKPSKMRSQFSQICSYLGVPQDRDIVAMVLKTQRGKCTGDGQTPSRLAWTIEG